MKPIKQAEELLKSLRFSETSKNITDLIKEAEVNDASYTTFLLDVLSYEKKCREEKLIEKHMKWATFPFHKTLNEFNLDEQASLSKKQYHQLKELTWIEQLFNLILLGPQGAGKTHLAVGLGIEAIHQGYKVSFISMGEMIHTLKTEEVTKKSQTRMKRIRNSDLVIIDDMMFMAMDQREANLFFHLINDLYNSASIIITSNKAPSDWGELMGDPSITAAILDRLIHRAEVIHMNEDSHRMKYRKTIFGNESVQN
ncbi:IS21-like element helper ATPase IstB [Bacillus shivajii]|uniref:IS21-like element helper ATPase IstB n=1 Tax=Bacillus shivajii TaxID=1983719 RepID=UPI001CFBA4B2|nr:IS21-like element helper ATPase IstB [Bacillus shivajii]UCZ54863.1 IS21-like element helper ATPase IstB [Bacillus shivajii]UCZ55079.1 IS21-like element helper ATPase IstB [Bacillus shivajii]